MSSFPEKITMQGDISFDPNQSPNPKNPFGWKVAQQEYIRADLVPQWQPIETIPDGETVIALDPYGRARVVTKNNESKDFPVEDKSAEASYAVAAFTHWMPIQKVPE